MRDDALGYRLPRLIWIPKVLTEMPATEPGPRYDGEPNASGRIVGWGLRDHERASCIVQLLNGALGIETKAAGNQPCRNPTQTR